MKQAGIYSDGIFRGNYKADITEEAKIIVDAVRQAVIDEALAHYTIINKKQNVKREDLCNG